MLQYKIKEMAIPPVTSILDANLLDSCETDNQIFTRASSIQRLIRS